MGVGPTNYCGPLRRRRPVTLQALHVPHIDSKHERVHRRIDAGPERPERGDVQGFDGRHGSHRAATASRTIAASSSTRLLLER